MSDFDLNITNYNVEDILNLFNLPYNFDKTELKNAKQIALKTHPDKSGLDKEIFMFFMKAFEPSSCDANLLGPNTLIFFLFK